MRAHSIFFWIIWEYVADMQLYYYVFQCLFSKNNETILLQCNYQNQEINMDIVLIIV